MEFKRNIYDFDIRAFVVTTMPTPLRKPKLTALLLALVSPIAELYAGFIRYKKEVEFELTVTGQVCYLQYMLNELYDYSERRIVIEDVGLNDIPALYLKSEGVESALITYLDGELEAEYFIPLQSEAEEEGGYFLVKVPASLEYDVIKMRAHLDKYKLPTTRYNIIEI